MQFEKGQDEVKKIIKLEITTSDARCVQKKLSTMQLLIK